MEWQLELYRQNDAAALLKTARAWLQEGERHRAASALDRAYGLQPEDNQIANLRAEILESLSRRVDGVLYRYVPAGYFLIGSKTGEADERPVRLVQLEAFRIAEVPVDWERFCRILGQEPPPHGDINELVKMRVQYCEDHTLRAVDWHAHYAGAAPEAMRGLPDWNVPRAERPHSWREKPLIAVSHPQAEAFCVKAGCRLPSETEWEKAARGGLIGKRYAWGDQPPDAHNCDFHRFEQFSIQPSRRFDANGYGLYAMCGGVWEWTATPYDALAYRGQPTPADALEMVVRGGSWSDCAEAVTVSFRGSRAREETMFHCSANVGFRPCLRE